ncbi:hypothetical protein NE237_027968 [Protea cynaroides]|uniref:Rad51-like C-terminal domain-containing protein n=1 Tax=Protea cynaroides TaxID=273540 RepID=A0A9Q0JTH4_9MAGN|nr:hypothetical protein NE237_027968 [Protea cynaroides]
MIWEKIHTIQSSKRLSIDFFLCGVPGNGKTQLGYGFVTFQLSLCTIVPFWLNNNSIQNVRIQLAVNVQIPVDYCGLGGKAIYVGHGGKLSLSMKDFQTWQDKLQPNAFLENIFYFRICTYTEQVKIVIVDSVTFHFRQDFDDLALRTRVLGGLALKLMKLAQKFSLAVKIVIVDSVTVHFCQDFDDLALRTRVLGGLALQLMKLGQKYSLVVTGGQDMVLKSPCCRELQCGY